MAIRDVLAEQTLLQLAELGATLREARQAARISREEFAERTALSVSTIRRLEAGDAGVAMGAYVSAMLYLKPLAMQLIQQAFRA